MESSPGAADGVSLPRGLLVLPLGCRGGGGASGRCTGRRGARRCRARPGSPLERT